MGLFSFLKKKDQLQLQPQGSHMEELPPLPPLDNQLPALDSQLPPIESPETPLPAIDAPLPEQAPSRSGAGITVNVPPLDFSMPASDDADEIKDDLDRLFFKDDWKEPDWTSFEPYSTPDVDAPNQEDFVDLTAQPQEDDAAQPPAQSQPSGLPQFDEDAQPRRESEPPLELYVKGSHYRNVFLELQHMNEALNRLDPRLGAVEELSHQEELSLGEAKNNMEFVYRRFMQIDKRVFG